MSSSQAVKVYGERNTGTNYLIKLLQLNVEAHLFRGTLPPRLARFRGFLNRMTANNWLINETYMDAYFGCSVGMNLGWKHGCPPRAALEKMAKEKELTVITLTRNPYSWLLALFKRPYHYQGDVKRMMFSEFLRRPWKATRRDRNEKLFANPIALWNVKNRAYRALSTLAGTRVVNATFENLLTDPQAFMTRLSSESGLRLKPGFFTNYEESVKRDDGKDHDYYKTYYREERWKQDLRSEDVAWINQHLDFEVSRWFGYEKLT